MRTFNIFVKPDHALRAFIFSVLLLIFIAPVQSSYIPSLIDHFADNQEMKAEFAGMVCIPLTKAQLLEVEKAYGEECGGVVDVVVAGS